MTEILLIRHGETAWNAVKRLQGFCDVPLNEEGVRQAESLAAALQTERVAAVYASDLQRAQQTAAAIARSGGLTVQTDADLRERCFGAFEGLLYAEIGARYPQAYAAWQARDADACLPDGRHAAETLRVFSARALGGIARIAARHVGGRIAIVSHGGVLECAYRAALGMSLSQPRDFQIFNASINRFAWEGGKLVLRQWGDIDHLARLRVAALDEIER